MSRQDEERVPVLDVRRCGGEQHLIDGLTRELTIELVPTGQRVIVVDDTDALETHHDWYGLLALDVLEAICVAVGPLTDGPSVELRQSAAVKRPWVTLWVGDVRGVRWAGGSDNGAATHRADGTALQELLAVLAAPAVFDEVIKQVGEVPYQTVSPALDVAFPGVDSGELRASHRQALQEITAEVRGGTLPEIDLPDPPGSKQVSTATTEPLPAESVLVQVRGLVHTRFAGARRAVSDLRGASGLLGSADAQAPTRAVAAVGQALGEHEKQADIMLTNLERRLASGTPTGGLSDAAGVELPAPDLPDNPVLADDLRTGIDTALRADHTLPETAAMLRVLALLKAPETLGPARKRLEAARTEGVPARLQSVPDATMPGVVLATIAAGALLTCLVSSALPEVGLVVGALLGLLWVAGVVVLQLRGPAREPAAAGGLVVRGLLVAAAAAFGVLAGRLVGVTAVPLGVELGIDAILAVTYGATIVWAWKQIVTRWLRGLGLDAAGTANDVVSRIIDDAIRGPYRGSSRRARATEAAGLLSTGVTDVNTVFTEWAASSDEERAHSQAAENSASAQLTAMLKGDLIAIALAALQDYLDDVAAGAPLAVSPTKIIDSTGVLAARYQDYLDSANIHHQPPVAVDLRAHARVAEALWQRSGESRRLLQGELRTTMTQLCRREDLRVLNSDWRGIRIFRFAPVEAQQILLGAVSDEVVPAEVGAAGLLRLVPLKGGVVNHVVPTSDTDNQTIGAS